MAFINITDPRRRKEIVDEYMKTKQELKDRAEDNKENNLIKTREIEERSRPIVEATEKSAAQIASAVKTNEQLKTPYDFYSSMTKNRDKYFSIFRTNDGSFKIGDTNIEIDSDNNIHLKGESYPYTSGLWNLIMLNVPDGYTDDDLEKYRSIVKIANIITNPRIFTSTDRFKSTRKYAFLNELFDVKEIGSGIILPGTISGLKDRLQLVCAERQAGNIAATTPEIVSILDELLRRDYISRPQYNEVCERLGC